MSSKLTQLPATPSPDPDDLMYLVRPALGANGSQGITNDNLFSTITRNTQDGAIRFHGAATIPPLSSLGQGAIYYDQTLSRFLISENGEAYKPIISIELLKLDLNSGQDPYLLPANTFKNAGDTLYVEIAGNFFLDQLQHINFNFGPTNLFNSGDIDIGPGANWRIFGSLSNWGLYGPDTWMESRFTIIMGVTEITSQGALINNDQGAYIANISNEFIYDNSVDISISIQPTTGIQTYSRFEFRPYVGSLWGALGVPKPKSAP